MATLNPWSSSPLGFRVAIFSRGFLSRHARRTEWKRDYSQSKHYPTFPKVGQVISKLAFSSTTILSLSLSLPLLRSIIVPPQSCHTTEWCKEEGNSVKVWIGVFHWDSEALIPQWTVPTYCTCISKADMAVTEFHSTRTPQNQTATVHATGATPKCVNFIP